MNESMTPLIEVICAAYKRYGPLKVLTQSFLNQTAGNWKLMVYHDGLDEQFCSVMESYAREMPDKVAYRCTEVRHNDWGHSLRAEGLKHANSDYVLLTNDDNYYVPRFIEIVTDAIAETAADVVLFDMIHSYDKPGGRPLPSYSFFKTEYRSRSIDMGAAIVRTSIARSAGFRDKSFAGDATYFMDVARAQPNFRLHKIDRVLFMHN